MRVYALSVGHDCTNHAHDRSRLARLGWSDAAACWPAHAPRRQDTWDLKWFFFFLSKYSGFPVSTIPSASRYLVMSNPSLEDLGNRFYAIDDNHQGGILWITASLSVTYFILSCILRVFISYPHLTKDTICLVIATVSLDIDCFSRQPLFCKTRILTSSI